MDHEVFFMADMNKYSGDKGELHGFCVKNSLVDTIYILNLDIETDPTYLYGTKRINYIFTTDVLAETPIK